MEDALYSVSLGDALTTATVWPFFFFPILYLMTADLALLRPIQVVQGQHHDDDNQPVHGALLI